MVIKFFKPSKFVYNAKCTIHASGKLGFSESAVKALEIDENKYIKLGVDDETEDKNLFMQITDKDDGEGFKVKKAGNYYYLTTKPLFDELMVNYREKKIIYDISKAEYEGELLYRLNRRELDRKTKK